MSSQLLQAFDPRSVNPASASGGSQLPVGEHPVVIEKAEVKPTAGNDGGYLQLDLLVIDGPAKGSRGAWRLNLYNQNAKAVEIAYRQLSALCYAVAFFDLLNDASKLCGKPFIAVVGLQRDKEAADKGYTEVKGCKDMQGRDPGATGAAPAPQAAPQGAPQGFPQQPPQQQQAPAGWQAPQQQAPQQPAAAPAWGGPPQGAAPAGAPAWGGAAPAQQAPAQAWGQGAPAHAPAQQPGGWQQGAPAGGPPAWAQR